MDLDQRVFYSLSLGLSFLNLIAMFALFYLLQSHTGYHRNLRTLFFVLNEAFACIALSNFLTAALNFGRESSADFTNEEEFLVGTSAFGMNLASVVFIALIVERAAATAFRAVYEHLSSNFGLLLMIVVCHALALAMSVCFSLYIANYYVQALIIFAVDAVSLIALVALYCTNNSLRQIDFRSEISLSQRYQNIRAVYTLMPLIVVGLLFSTFGIAASALQNVISTAFRLRLPVYNLIMNVYVLLAFLMAIRRDLRMRHGFFQLLQCGRKKKVADGGVEAVKIKNVLGKEIIAENTTNFHFKHLHSLWD